MTNKITVIGNLGKDPEQKTTPNGKKGYFFSVASSQYYKKEKVTTWYKCAYWGESEFINNFVKKGSKVLLTGTLLPPSPYISKSNEPRVELTLDIHYIEFLGEKPSKEGTSPTGEIHDSFEDVPF